MTGFNANNLHITSTLPFYEDKLTEHGFKVHGGKLFHRAYCENAVIEKDGKEYPCELRLSFGYGFIESAAITFKEEVNDFFVGESINGVIFAEDGKIITPDYDRTVYGSVGQNQYMILFQPVLITGKSGTIINGIDMFQTPWSKLKICLPINKERIRNVLYYGNTYNAKLIIQNKKVGGIVLTPTYEEWAVLHDEEPFYKKEAAQDIIRDLEQSLTENGKYPMYSITDSSRYTSYPNVRVSNMHGNFDLCIFRPKEKIV